jgi:hypothetical protein
MLFDDFLRFDLLTIYSRSFPSCLGKHIQNWILGTDPKLIKYLILA